MRFGRTSAKSKASAGKASAGRRAWSGKPRRSAPNVTEDERVIRTGFWVKVRRQAAQLPFAEDLLSAYYCAFDRGTPLQVRAVLLGALAYFVLPFDGIPDILPPVSYTHLTLPTILLV